MPAQFATYKKMEQLLKNALHDLTILSGDRVGASGASWQDYAGTAADNLESLANQLRAARAGNCESFITFPSPEECLEAEMEGMGND